MRKSHSHALMPKLAILGLISACMLTLKSHAQLLPPPNILVQPLDQTVTNMGSVTFSVEMDASISITLSYQWQFNGVDLKTPGSSGTKLLTLGNAWISYTQPNNTTNNAGKYSVKLTSTLGATEVSSNAILKVVNSPATIGAAKMSATGFQVLATGITGVNFIFYASSNLTTWTPVYTNTSLTGSASYTDTSAALFKQRYYKILIQ